MTTAATIRRPVSSTIAAPWRFFRRCLRCLRRKWWKIGIWLITLTALAWQYENWHGRRDLAEQRALWKAEYGDMKQSDFVPPRIPDDENFFASPIFETFVVKEPRRYLTTAGPDERERQEYSRKCNEAADALPHGRFLRMQLPSIESSPETVAEIPAGQGFDILDIPAWAQSTRNSARIRPDGMTDARWLLSTFPPDSTVKGFIAALSRRKARLLPHPADRWKVGEQLGTPWASPIPAMSNMFACCRSLALRARVAARAGDRLAARQLNEVLWLLTEGLSGGSSLVETLVAIAYGDVAESATVEGLACRCWNDADLAILSERLAAIDEEKTLLYGLYHEAFHIHLWTGAPLPLFQSSYLALFSDSKWGKRLYGWILLHGPRGWEDANLAQHLRWWRMLLVPDSPGDDLVALREHMETGLQKVMEEVRDFSPWSPSSVRKVWAVIVIPAMTNIAGNALAVQARRRQLLLAIAIERFALAHGALPQKPEDLVPGFLPAIPNDPHQAGTPLRWEPGTGGIRYRILSAGKDTALAMPESLPQ